MGGRLCCLTPCKSSWTGQFVNRRKEGRGLFHDSNGDVYEGDMLQDERHGSGCIRYADGSLYDGDWRHGLQHGHGVWKSAAAAASASAASAAVAAPTRGGDGDDEEADGHQQPQQPQQAAGGGARHPQVSPQQPADCLCGSQVLSYSGEWRCGRRDGQGVLMYSDGSIYSGGFSGGRPSGQGELVRKDGSCYVGDWRDGLYDGCGVLTRLNGDVLEGRFVRGVMEGDGRVTRYCGDELSGCFSNGLLVGQAELRRRWQPGSKQPKLTLLAPASDSQTAVAASQPCHRPSDASQAGEEDGEEGGWLVYRGDVSAEFEMHGEGTLHFPNGDTCWGRYVRGCGVGRDGEVGEKMWSRFVYGNGDVWEGEMKGWKRDGEGELRYSDGGLYIGSCSDDRRQGRGSMEDDDGLYSGDWKDDMKDGDGVMEYRDGRRYEGHWRSGRKHGRGVIYFTQQQPANTAPASPSSSLLPSSSSSTPGQPPEPEDLFISDWRDDEPQSVSSNLRLAPLRLLQHRLFHLDEALRDVETDRIRVDPARLCVVCGVGLRQVMLLDCRHLVCCEACARGSKGGEERRGGGSIRSCPVCNARVVRLVTVHES